MRNYITKPWSGQGLFCSSNHIDAMHGDESFKGIAEGLDSDEPGLFFILIQNFVCMLNSKQLKSSPVPGHFLIKY